MDPKAKVNDGQEPHNPWEYAGHATQNEGNMLDMPLNMLAIAHVSHTNNTNIVHFKLNQVENVQQTPQ